MTDRGKKIFLAICIIVPFLVYCVYYYGIMIKNAPYKFSEMESISLKYGLGDSLVNQFDSKSGTYQYVNDQDSIVKAQVNLRKDDLLYLHRKAAELGYWNFPENMRGDAAGQKMPNAPHYILEYKYQHKIKRIDFDLNYNGDPKLKEAAKSLIDMVSATINDAEDKQQK
ncbi:MAG: hypothetical protein ACKOW2_06170 [Sphingobacteriaceae bacterium]